MDIVAALSTMHVHIADVLGLKLWQAILLCILHGLLCMLAGLLCMLAGLLCRLTDLLCILAGLLDQAIRCEMRVSKLVCSLDNLLWCVKSSRVTGKQSARS